LYELFTLFIFGENFAFFLRTFSHFSCALTAVRKIVDISHINDEQAAAKELANGFIKFNAFADEIK